MKKGSEVASPEYICYTKFMRYLLVLFLFLTGCGTFTSHGPAFIDEAFQPYYDLYLQHKLYNTGSDATARVDIVFGRVPGQFIGRCWVYEDGHRRIEIDMIYWNTATDKSKEVLLFHELGHCDLSRHHTTPKSIMEPYHIGGTVFAQNETYYLQELFQLIPQQKVAIVHTIGYPNTDGGKYGKGTNHTCGSNRLR